jgi:hypothetical protein
MARYFDPAVSWEELRADGGPLVEDYPGYAAKKVREDLLRTHSYNPSSVRPYLTRPFDLQWCYYVAQQPLWRRPRPEFGRQAWDGNIFLLTRFNASGPGDGTVASHASSLSDYSALLQRAVAIPRMLRDAPGTAAQLTAFATDEAKANLSSVARDYLSTIGLDSSAEKEKADLIWQHVLAVAMGPDYLQTFERLLADDYPRVPLPLDADVLSASAELGSLVAALLDVETPVPGVTTGAIAPHLQALGAFTFQGGGPLNLDKHLVLDAEWGYQDKANKVMPGPGRTTERDYTPTEIAVLESRARELGLTREALQKVLGARTVDVYLNSDACWSNVPANAWGFAVTKNRVLKKWLSY